MAYIIATKNSPEAVNIKDIKLNSYIKYFPWDNLNLFRNHLYIYGIKITNLFKIQLTKL